MLPIGTEVFCYGYSQWGEFTFQGVIEDYTYDYDEENFSEEDITGYSVRSTTGVLHTVWLRDAIKLTEKNTYPFNRAFG